MSERGKFYKKKFVQPRDQTIGRMIFNSKTDSYSSKFDRDPKESSTSESSQKMKQPTILLKAREPTEEVSASPKRSNKESDIQTVTIMPSTASKETDSSPNLAPKQMHRSEKLLDDGIIFSENIQEYLQENSDFLVVGVVGAHGVGKSTVLNLLANRNATDNLKKTIFKQSTDSDEFDEPTNTFTENNNTHEIFKVQSVQHLETNMNATYGIDLYITPNRVILLDCQPFASISVLEDLIKYENKRTNLVSEFIPIENSGEIQGLQLTAFLMSVCHVLILVQDWFFDCNVIRFIQSAEMLKPTISNPEDELTDHFPNLLLIHNKAQLEDFSPKKFKLMQQVYRELFEQTKLNIESNMGLGTGRIINYLNSDNCGSPINLFLIPEIDQLTDVVYNGHPPIEELFKKLKNNILGTTRNPLTHVQLTEKTWLVYCTKVWETVKKSPFFVEYTKLMP